MFATSHQHFITSAAEDLEDNRLSVLGMHAIESGWLKRRRKHFEKADRQRHELVGFAT
jgi:hypothetical protein